MTCQAGPARILGQLRLGLALLSLLLAWTLGPAFARAESGPTLTLSFTPTPRAQLAVWIERPDGTFLETLALTYSVANLGLGNRPGALQMNSGYRWPYGRREGVLPVWAHARASAESAKPFRRVIFQDRDSEGHASRTRSDQSADDYYCLSFDHDISEQDALDAVTCPSVFSSDKGRFITETDVTDGYAEPFEPIDGTGEMRPLTLVSLYPPRRDVKRCESRGCYDHADVDLYAEHALSVMPNLDAVTRATPEGGKALTWTFSLPADWPVDTDYVLYIEANVEGDYNATYNDQSYPTPLTPKPAWDKWARTFGYPYRGQPSITYAVPFRLSNGAEAEVRDPAGYGALHGEDGELRPLDDTMEQSPDGSPGSGADRLLLRDDRRARLQVTLPNPCSQESPPPECGMPCAPGGDDCGDLTCNAQTETCAAFCTASQPVPPVLDLSVEQYEDRLHAHTLASLTFRAPGADRAITGYQVRLRPEGGAWEQAFTPDSAEDALPVALDLCADEARAGTPCEQLPAGHAFEATLAGLKPSTHYDIEVRAQDGRCGELGGSARSEFTTPERQFATVAPCFVATAAYGSAWTQEVRTLRRFRNEVLRSHAWGRAFIRFYEAIGPPLARFIEPHPKLRAAVRTLLEPAVALARHWLA